MLFGLPLQSNAYFDLEFAPMSGPMPLRTPQRRASASPFNVADNLPAPRDSPEPDEVGGVVVDTPKISNASNR